MKIMQKNWIKVKSQKEAEKIKQQAAKKGKIYTIINIKNYEHNEDAIKKIDIKIKTNNSIIWVQVKKALLFYSWDIAIQQALSKQFQEKKIIYHRITLTTPHTKQHYKYPNRIRNCDTPKRYKFLIHWT